MSGVRAAPQALFDRLDDQTRLAEHMGGPYMMMDGRMSYSFDGGEGRAVGSVIRMRGSFLGLMLYVGEEVTEQCGRFTKLGRPAAVRISS